jgi:GT2 family glycosyltransferase
MKKIATIIVTYNGEKWIQKCLDSVLNSTYSSDIYLVDNCSTDNTLAIVKEYSINFEALNTNSGFGFANNYALKKMLNSDYDYFFLMNQDLYLEENVLGKLISFAESHLEMGIIAPIQFDGNGEKIDANFQQYIKLSEEKENYFETSFCNAAAWLVSKSCIEKVGLFNPLFQHYGEDRNYCERAKFHDFKISIVKNTKVLHDRIQQMTTEKAIKLAKIKLLTIFLNPNKTKSESLTSGLINVFGISKYLFKKYRSYDAVFQLFPEYLRLLKDQTHLEKEKLKQK